MSYATATVFKKRGLRRGRANQTADKIIQCFSELLAEKPFDKISAIELADRAKIARSTVYRRWAGTEDLYWQLLRPHIEWVLHAALSGDFDDAAAAIASCQNAPRLQSALASPGCLTLVRKNLSILAESEVQRRTGRKQAQVCALVIASSIVAYLQRVKEETELKEARELAFMIFLAGVMGPDSMSSALRARAGRSAGRFPPAVSVQESLAREEYIVSMIDGRPYQSLRRHLTRYGMTPEDYRACFDLSPEYPMVARAYSRRRSELAKRTLGVRAVVA